MIRLLLVTVFALALPALADSPESSPRAIRIAAGTRSKIASLIWKNESDHSVKGLVDWNKGEAFASLGIGHFIWYPTATKGPYEESFPPMLRFLRDRGIALPAWLDPETTLCPWPDVATFKAVDAKGEDPRIAELRRLLESTVDHQMDFIIARCTRSLQKMLETCQPEEAPALRSRFSALASTDDGLYCLLDYVNFKGEGTNPEENNNGVRWGLMQVLLAMPGTSNPAFFHHEFAVAASATLTRRVKNAPPEKAETDKKNLAGWLERCESYRKGI